MTSYQPHKHDKKAKTCHLMQFSQMRFHIWDQIRVEFYIEGITSPQCYKLCVQITRQIWQILNEEWIFIAVVEGWNQVSIASHLTPGMWSCVISVKCCLLFYRFIGNFLYCTCLLLWFVNATNTAAQHRTPFPLIPDLFRCMFCNFKHWCHTCILKQHWHLFPHLICSYCKKLVLQPYYFWYSYTW